MEELEINQIGIMPLHYLKITSMLPKQTSLRNINRIIETYGQVKNFKTQGKIKLKIIAEISSHNFSFLVKQLQEHFIIDSAIDERAMYSKSSELLELTIVIYLN